MTERFTQPDIPRPDNKRNPYYNGFLPTKHREWLRAAGPQLGIDTPKFIRGQLLSNLAYDDSTNYLVHQYSTEPRWVNISKINALLRLDGELEAPELPDELREKLTKMREVAAKVDWNDQERFKQVVTLRNQLREEVRSGIDENSEWRDAYLYAIDSEVQKKWAPHWERFIGE